MNTRSKGKGAVPGAFPTTFSQSGSTSASEGGSMPNTPGPSSSTDMELLSRNLHQVVIDQENSAIPKRQGKINRRKSIARSPAPANEIGVIIPTAEPDTTLRPGAKGKGIASALAATARLVVRAGTSSSSRSVSLPQPAPEVMEISSDSEGESSKSAVEVKKLRRQVSSLKKEVNNQRSKLRLTTTLVDVSVAQLREQLAEQAAELKAIKQREAEFRETVTHSLTCQVCDDLMHKPYALNPCGHVCCLTCLQAWFKSGSDEDDEYMDSPHRKSCPYCRNRIKTRPVQIFIIKTLVEAVDAEAHKAASAAEPSGPEDPWEGIFGEGHDSDDEDDEEGDSLDEESLGPCDACGEESAVDEEGYCQWCGFNHNIRSDEEDEDEEVGEEELELQDLTRLDAVPEADRASSGSGEAYDSFSDEEDPEGYDAEAMEAHPDNWIMPRPAPPCNHWMSRSANLHLSAQEFALCSRGVPHEMILKFSMAYDPERGISAKVANGVGLIWFGWNLVGVEDIDVDGTAFVENMLRDMRQRDYAWTILRRRNSWEAWRLIRLFGPEDVDHGDEADVAIPLW